MCEEKTMHTDTQHSASRKIHFGIGPALLAAALAVASAHAALASDNPGLNGAAPRKKLIGCGWGDSEATPATYLAHADRFDRCGLDGMLFRLKTRLPDGSLKMLFQIFDEEWRYEDFAAEVPNLRKMAEHPGLRHNFLGSLRAPLKKRAAWDDDAVWGRVAANMRVVARLARDGGCRGLSMDCEDYKKLRQFKRQPGEPPLEDLRGLVRRRGAEVFRGVFEEFPDVTILSFWFLSLSPNWYGPDYGRKDMAALADGMEDLWPAFVNGILDVLPPTATLIDGNESYHCDADKNDFYRQASWIRSDLAALVDPANREKYARQMQVSTGMYLDMYVNPTNSPWYFPPKDGSRLETFRRNLAQALDAADEYLWIYSEKLQFIEWDDDYPLQKACQRETLEHRLPGLSDLMAAQKDPDGFARERLAELKAEGMLTNLVSNATCKGGADGGVPKPFGFWRPTPKDGKAPGGMVGTDDAFGDGDSSSLCATGVDSGSFTLDVKGIVPGEYYLISASAYGPGTSVTMSWRDAKHKYTGKTQHLPLVGQASDWHRGQVLMRAPPKAAKASLTLNVRLAPDEKAHFDNICIYRLTYSTTTEGKDKTP